MKPLLTFAIICVAAPFSDAQTALDQRPGVVSNQNSISWEGFTEYAKEQQVKKAAQLRKKGPTAVEEAAKVEWSRMTPAQRQPYAQREKALGTAATAASANPANAEIRALELEVEALSAEVSALSARSDATSQNRSAALQELISAKKKVIAAKKAVLKQ